MEKIHIQNGFWSIVEGRMVTCRNLTIFQYLMDGCFIDNHTTSPFLC